MMIVLFIVSLSLRASWRTPTGASCPPHPAPRARGNPSGPRFAKFLAKFACCSTSVTVNAVFTKSSAHARKGTHRHTWAQQEQRWSRWWQLGSQSPASYPCPQIGQSWQWHSRPLMSQGSGKYCLSMANSKVRPTACLGMAMSRE